MESSDAASCSAPLQDDSEFSLEARASQAEIAGKLSATDKKKIDSKADKVLKEK